MIQQYINIYIYTYIIYIIIYILHILIIKTEGGNTYRYIYILYIHTYMLFHVYISRTLFYVSSLFAWFGSPLPPHALSSCSDMVFVHGSISISFAMPAAMNLAFFPWSRTVLESSGSNFMRQRRRQQQHIHNEHVCHTTKSRN